MTQMRIDAITVGDRRREDMGDIAGLASSIDKYGLIHAIVVDPNGVLIAGGRRLEACKSLGMKWVEVRQWDELTDAELREIELEENLRRKDLTPYEESRTLASLAETAASVLRDSFTESVNESPRRRGGQPKPDAEPKVAERIGRPLTTMREAKQHVETAEAFPVFQKPDWKQYHVLEAREVLNKLPETERTAAVALIDQPYISPKDAIQTLQNIAAMPEPKREEVFRLAESSDSRDRTLALTTAAEKPPMPDPRLSVLRDCASLLNRCVREFPDDPHSPRIESLIRDIRELVTAIKEAA